MIIVDRPAYDYATFTTYSDELYKDAAEWFRETTHKDLIKKYKKWGYSGYSCKEWFFGMGEQAGRRHYMIELYGAIADEMIPPFMYDGWVMTRCDVQYTTALRSDWCGLTLGLYLKHGKWSGRGGTPVTEVIGGRPDGLDTVYSGNRHKSDRYTRMYIKVDEVGNKYIRFETIFRKKYAKPTADNMPAYCSYMVKLIDRMPKDTPAFFDEHVRDIIRPALDKVANGEPPPKGEEVEEQDATLSWLFESVLPAVSRLVKESPNKRGRVSMLLSLCSNELLKARYEEITT